MLRKTLSALLLSISLDNTTIPADRFSLDDHLSDIELAELECLRNNLNPKLCKALLLVESSGRRAARSPVGAIGLMQIMPANAAFCRLAPAELQNPRANIACGARLLAYHIKLQKGDVILGVQSYNGGSRCLNRCRESINHARKVLSAFAKDVA